MNGSSVWYAWVLLSFVCIGSVANNAIATPPRPIPPVRFVTDQKQIVIPANAKGVLLSTQHIKYSSRKSSLKKWLRQRIKVRLMYSTGRKRHVRFRLKRISPKLEYWMLIPIPRIKSGEVYNISLRYSDYYGTRTIQVKIGSVQRWKRKGKKSQPRLFLSKMKLVWRTEYIRGGGKTRARQYRAAHQKVAFRLPPSLTLWRDSLLYQYRDKVIQDGTCKPKNLTKMTRYGWEGSHKIDFYFDCRKQGKLVKLVSIAAMFPLTKKVIVLKTVKVEASCSKFEWFFRLFR